MISETTPGVDYCNNYSGQNRDNRQEKKITHNNKKGFIIKSVNN